MRNNSFIQDENSAGTRGTILNRTRVDIHWLENGAEAIDCRGDDTERKHWKKTVRSMENGIGMTT